MTRNVGGRSATAVVPSVPAETESATPAAPPTDRRAELWTYLAGAAVTVVALFWMMRLWQADLTVPFFYLGNDSTAVAAHAKTVLETGWYEYQPALGAPVGQHYHDFPTADNLHMMAFGVLGLFTNNFAVALNVYYLLGFPLAALTALYFLRQVGVSRVLAMPLGVLYALAPYHFLRNEGHLFLASYYPLPLALVVVLRLIRGQAVWGVRTVDPSTLRRLPVGWRPPAARLLGLISGRGAATVLMLGVLVTASTYYAVFVLLLIAAAGLVRLLRTGDRRRFVGAVLAGGTVVAVAVLNMLPDVLYSLVNGANSQALSRDGAASEIYGLKIASLLLPAPGHPIPIFSAFRYRYDESYPVPSESPALGFVAAVGLVILLVMTVGFVANRLRERVESDAVLERREILRQLATLTVVAVLTSTVGGLSTIFSFINPSIRGWNRITIVIALFCLAAVGVLADGWCARRLDRRAAGDADRATARAADRATNPGLRRPRLPLVVAGLVLVVGVADQSLVSAVPPYAESAAGFHSDQDFVRGIEARVAADSMIFQLPYVDFPESPSVNGVADADQLKLYLSSTTLRWSAGGIRGRPQSDWPSVVTSQGTQTLVQSLATIGFAGIVVDRKRAGDAVTLIEAALAASSGAPELISANGRYAYFSLKSEIAQLQQGTPADVLSARAAALTNPVMAYPGSQFNSFDRAQDGVGYKLWQSRAGTGSIPVVNDRETAATVHLDIQIGSSSGAPDVQITVGDTSYVAGLPAPVETQGTATDAAATPQDPTFVHLDQVITIPAGTSEIRLSPGPQTIAAGTDPQTVHYDFHHLLLLDDRLGG